MEEKTIQESLERMSKAYAKLALDKQDFEDGICSEIDFLATQYGGSLTPVEKRNIKKVAKSMADSKTKDLTIESDHLADILSIVNVGLED